MGPRFLMFSDFLPKGLSKQNGCATDKTSGNKNSSKYRYIAFGLILKQILQSFGSYYIDVFCCWQMKKCVVFAVVGQEEGWDDW